jgi:Lon protease-like protein
VTSALPLFPLGAVLFPGLVLPLHVFEERYRALIRDLMARPDGTPREFGVVAIRSGWEVDGVGPGNEPAMVVPATRTIPTLYEVGCLAQLRQVTQMPDGEFDIVVVGQRRFRVGRLDPLSAPYLHAEVEWLDEPTDDGGPVTTSRHLADSEDTVELHAAGVIALYQRYLLRVHSSAGDATNLPDTANALSYRVAASIALSLEERQHLLALPDAASRLRAEYRMLNRELVLLDRVRAVPVPLPELAVPSSPN